MADADEDVIPRASAAEPEDLEDETQDFRFLSQLTSSTRTGQAIIPKRGTKDFEPNPTRSQSSALDASRLAMHTALSAVRIHAAKSHVVGQYLPNEGNWRWDEDGTGVRHGRCVVVYRFKSTHLKVMGQADRNNWVWLLPEEALFLLERGNLDLRWPDINDKDDDTAAGEQDKGCDIIISEEDAAAENKRAAGEDDDDNNNNTAASAAEPRVGELPMSLQGAYAGFIGKDGLTLERYTVYAGLKRAGYIVQRAPTWHDNDPPQPKGRGYHAVPPPASSLPTALRPTSLSSSSHPRAAVSNIASLIHRLVSYLFRPQRGESCPSLGPLVAPGLYRNYADIFRALTLIPYHDANSPSETSTQTPQAPYRIHFHVWKPAASSTYKKTSPPPPDYRICVIDARSTPSIPSLSQIGPLLDSQPEDSVPKDKGRLEARIKHGKRNVLLAVVDMGVVSYLRLSDACFGGEKLFEEKVRTGTKGGRRRPQGQGQAQAQGRRPGQTRQN